MPTHATEPASSASEPLKPSARRGRASDHIDAARRLEELEAAFQELSARHEGLLESLNDIVFTVGPDGAVQDLAGNTMGVLGAMPASFARRSARSLLALVHREDRGAVLNAVRRGLHEATAASTLARVRDAAGEYRWLEISFFPVFPADINESPSALRGTARDVTERVRAARMIESLNRAAQAVQSPGMAPGDVLEAVSRQLGELGFCSMVCLCDDARAARPGYATASTTGSTAAFFGGRVARAGGPDAAATEFACQEAGCPLREMLSAGVSPVIPPAAELRAAPECAAIAPRGALWPHNCRSVIAAPLVAQDVTLGVLLVAGPQVDATGVPGVAAFANQAAIAYRNAQLLESLRAGEAQYHTVFDTVTDGLTVFDDEGTIWDVNPASCRIYGYSHDELAGMSLSRLVHPDQYHGLANLKAGVARDGTFRARSVNVRKDGSLIDVEICASALAFQGRELYLTVDTDITERLRTERALVRSEKLRALGQMAGGVAHDFNNLLSAVRGFCSLALLELEAEPARAREDLERALASTLDAAEAVRRLQSLYRPADDTSDLAPLDLDTLATEAVALTQPRWKDEAQRRGYTIRVVTELSHPRLVLGNASELRRVLSNLVMNAVDAMPEGGTLTVSTAQDGDWAAIGVRDTGIGISAEQQSQLFEPFYTTKGTAGSGLGLTLSLGIVERHGGRIAVESALGQGSTFTVYLPCCAPELVAATAVSRAPEPAAPPANLDVLVVDDERAVLSVLERLLTREGHRVSVAPSGAAALAMLREHRYDLVITDLGMPEVSGHKVARLARLLYPSMPVILATGWGETVSPEQLASIGATHLLSKPYAYEELMAAVEAAMRPRASGPH